jgi:hypothetical protein
MSATCTSAGCLLPVSSASHAAGMMPACCAVHSNGQPNSNGSAGHHGGKDCPLCHQSAVVGKSTESATASLAFHGVSILLLAVVDLGVSYTAPNGCCLPAKRQAPSSIPSTLLALHCALLN